MVVLQFKYGNEDVGKYSYVVQGVGYVGMEFIKLLCEQGVKVFVIDINKELVQWVVDEFGCEVVGLDEIYDVDVDVYLLCVLGGMFNEKIIDCIKVKIICGVVNNQLVINDIGDELICCGVLYVLDYVVNVGGVMNILLEIDGYNCECVMCMMWQIYYNLGCIFEISKIEGVLIYQVVDCFVEECIVLIGKIKLLYMGNGGICFQGCMCGQ